VSDFIAQNTHSTASNRKHSYLYYWCDQCRQWPSEMSCIQVHSIQNIPRTEVQVKRFYASIRNLKHLLFQNNT